MFEYLNSNFFVAITTVIVVFIGFGIQKQEEKKSAATIILTEIRSAEDTLMAIKSGCTSTNISRMSILPVNSWSKFNYLFAADLDRDELKSLNEFYKQCSLAESAIKRFNDIKEIGRQEKAKMVVQELSNLAVKYSGRSVEENMKKDSDYTKEKEFYLGIVNAEDYLFNPNEPLDELTRSLNSVQFVTTSTVGTKLKKIAGIKNSN